MPLLLYVIFFQNRFESIRENPQHVEGILVNCRCEEREAESWKLYLAKVQPEETLDNFSILKYCAVLFASFRRISVSEPVPVSPSLSNSALVFIRFSSSLVPRASSFLFLLLSHSRDGSNPDRRVRIALFPFPNPPFLPRGSKRYYAKYFLPCFEEPAGNTL